MRGGRALSMLLHESVQYVNHIGRIRSMEWLWQMGVMKSMMSYASLLIICIVYATVFRSMTTRNIRKKHKHIDTYMDVGEVPLHPHCSACHRKRMYCALIPPAHMCKHGLGWVTGNIAIPCDIMHNSRKCPVFSKKQLNNIVFVFFFYKKNGNSKFKMAIGRHFVFMANQQIIDQNIRYTLKIYFGNSSKCSKWLTW